MADYKKQVNLTGWLVFLIAFIVYFFSAERTGSLWDCGEFILGAYKLQVVHPPGAPLFLIVGRMFAWLGDILSSNPEDIAFAVNIMSSLSTAFAAMFVAWATIILGKMALVGREGTVEDPGAKITLLGSGLIAGLATAFCSSIWFSAVEGEVYAMSTFFTALTFWSAMKWYNLPDTRDNDRWLVFTVYAAGLSIGVHLLSILTFPALALFYYFKKYEKHTVKGVGIAAILGVVAMYIIQKGVIVGIPAMWATFELFCVNTLGLPFHSGIFPTILALGALFYFGLRYAHRKKSHILQLALVSLLMAVMAFSTYGAVVIRANANPPINMNEPSDAMRLLPYLNREQYGERPLLRGPHFDAKPVSVDSEDRYGRVGDKYEVVDEKLTYEYANKDKILFPRIGHTDRASLHRMWMDENYKKPSMGYNLYFLMKYQLGWMYWRYFMWNFAGRQNGEQGFYPWDKKDGHWLSGIKPLDEARLYNMDELPETMKKDQSRNKYYLLPFLFGLIGLSWMYTKDKKSFFGLLVLFIITGIGIIIYSNQPPNEPRERDYVLVGSFFVYSMWIGMAAIALYEILRDKAKLKGITPGALATVVILSAPVIMGAENFDDHTRYHLQGARDYAIDFLESTAPNAIIFTYGDNDTYPLWYAQEVEGIRTDVRVVNLSLIAVDWYINGLRRKINDSEAVKLTIPAEAYRGRKRNQLFFYDPNKQSREMSALSALKFMGEQHPLSGGQGRTFESFLPSKNLYIPVDIKAAQRLNMLLPGDTAVVDRIPIKISGNYITKDDLAVLDIIASNIWERPIYFATTVREEKLMGLQDYTQLEGLSLRIVPVKSKSDDSYYIYGSGRVATDIIYDRVMNKFQWGNFDKYDMHVDNSFGATTQSLRMMFIRTIVTMMEKGQNGKAVDLCDKYFEAFPHMNFPYNSTIMPFINVYVQAGAFEQAKKHLRILAEETADYMEFYYSLDQEDLENTFRRDYLYANNVMRDCIDRAQQVNDPAFAEEIKNMLVPYQTANLKQ